MKQNTLNINIINEIIFKKKAKKKKIIKYII